jgi:hypothetical protein
MEQSIMSDLNRIKELFLQNKRLYKIADPVNIVGNIIATRFFIKYRITVVVIAEGNASPLNEKPSEHSLNTIF